MRIVALAVVAGVLVAGCAGRGHAPASAPARADEQRFADPEAAVAALLAACRTGDEAALVAIFGPGSEPLVRIGDTTADRERCRTLVDAAKRMTRLDPKGPDTLELVVGSDDWPFPIPLVKDPGGWRFDTERGAVEVARRRIGADELEAIRVSRAYVRAQEEYARTHREGGVATYAGRLASTSGFGPGVAAADASAGARPAAAWWGYHFRILDAQGKRAPGGPRSYLVDGKLIGGFALVAYPAEYGWTGVMTFIVSRDGRVYEKDLGAKTSRIAAAMKAYDPDSSWRLVTPDPPTPS